MARLVFEESTESTLTVYITGLDNSYERYDRFVYLYYSYIDPVSGYQSVVYDVISLDPHITRSDSYDIYGLEPNTYYTVWCDITYTDYAGGPTNLVTLDSISAWTDQGTPDRPDFFSWTYPKVSGEQFNLRAFEWNRLTANINAVRAYKGEDEISFTTAYSGDYFTASMYNQAVYAIWGMNYGDDLNTVSRKDDIYAYQLNDLVDAINSVK